MKKITSILLMIIIALTACIDEPVKDVNTNKGNFEALWKIIDTRYCYLDYKNINWDSIHDVYSLRFDNSTDKIVFFDAMAEMLAELKDGHVNLYSDFNTSRYWKWFSDYPANYNSDLIFSDRYLGDNYKSVNGLRYGKLANGRIGYINYTDFTNYFLDTNITNIFKYFADCEALIVDVRDNGGGYLDLSEQFASYFFEKETITGYIQHKIGDGHTDFSKPEAVKTPAHSTIKWKRPVAVLSNRKSYSATNSFICRMKQAPNAIIVGDKSGGGGGLPFSSELPNGWMVRFSASPMFDADMNQTEFGIDPDFKVDISSTDEANGIDTIIETAIQQLLN